MNITQKLIPVNKYNRPGSKSTPKRICVHYTGSPKSGADTTAKYYSNVAAGMFAANGSNTWTSAHYIVGINGEIIQCIPDNEIAYAAANQNANTIHIEVCHLDSSGEFTESSIASLAELVQYLLGKYNISSDNLLRHYDLTGKQCPIYYADERRWNNLKTILLSEKSADNNNSDSNDSIASPNNKFYRVQVGAFSSRSNAQNYADQMTAKGYQAVVVEVDK